MYAMTTYNIEVNVNVFYQQLHSRPSDDRYIYAYQIGILNKRPDKVQLLRRHWVIKDSNGAIKEVEGEGVIGQQPILMPQQSHQYNSWVPLETDIGLMYGTYLMRSLDTKQTFRIRIPKFDLIPPFKMN